MTDDAKHEREALADELQAAGEHPCRAHQAFGKLLRDGAATLRQPQTDALEAENARLLDIIYRYIDPDEARDEDADFIRSIQ
jgi:hypothetical protein